MPSVSFSENDVGYVEFLAPFSDISLLSPVIEGPVQSALLLGDLLIFFSNSTDFVSITNRTTWPTGDGYIVNEKQPDLVMDFVDSVYRKEKATP